MAELNYPIVAAELTTTTNNNSVVRNPSQDNTLEFSSPPPMDLALAVVDASSTVISSTTTVDANAAVVFPVARPLTFFDAFAPIPAHAARQDKENSDSSSSSIVHGRVPGPDLLDLDLNTPPPLENA